MRVRGIATPAPDATFFQRPTGSDSVGGSLVTNLGWQEVTGVLVAPVESTDRTPADGAAEEQDSYKDQVKRVTDHSSA
jgi:hypothetical protein